LRSLADLYPKETVLAHLLANGEKLRKDPKLGKAAEDNWYCMYGDELPRG